ncbi:DUF4349 domain-containing protein [uncultured Oscillibacter sp.]|uniref:DUF4349 domain-containing protein n=1 Tax=uncultured Oscillibacter sp. TaxID=876091 RepID=UPI0025CF3C15|nr:DUF4349 domain-containing protein [uncultured Oscillibacter sp.]
MKRGLALILVALLTALALTACGGGGDGGGMTASSGSDAPADYYGGAESSGVRGDWGFQEADGGLMEPSAAPTEEEGQTEPEDRLANAKMVYTAGVEAETMDFDECASGLEALVEQMGGYMEYASIGSYADGRRMGDYTIRVPSARFSGFLKSVGELSHVTEQSKSAENISEQYYDTESRLTTQRTKLERLQMLLAKAEEMEDIITLESAIAETELQIEQLTGSLRRYDALVDYATVELRLREVPRLTTVEEAPPTFSSQLGNAFADGLHSFGDFLQGMAIFLAYNWIWLTLLALAAAAAVGISKRRQARRAETFGQARAQGLGASRRKKGDGPEGPDDKQPKT